MATLRKETSIAAPAAQVWAALRDVGHADRVFAGVLVDAHMDGDDARIVTFANGTVARERLVDCDEARRRLVYSVVSERVSHHNASVQVVAEDEARCRLIWIVDVLPNEIAPYIDAQMDRAALAMQKTLAQSAKVETGLASDRAR